MDERLLVRADAGGHMGTGHVMRCLALAQAWQDSGGQALFAMAGDPEPLAARLAQEGLAVEPLAAEPGSEEDARCTVELARRCGAGWLVLDGYQFEGSYQRQLQDAAPFPSARARSW